MGTEFKWTPAHRYGLYFLIWCSLSVLWATSQLDALNYLWRFWILGLVFCIGSSIKNIKPHLILFAIGIMASGFLSIAQHYGFTWIRQGSPPSGLLMNKNYLAEVGLICLVAMLVLRQWWGILILPAIIMPQSMGVFIASGLTAAYWLWGRHRGLAVAAGVSAVLAVLWLVQGYWGHFWDTSWGSRLAIYLNSLVMVIDRPWGWGIGNYWTIYPEYHSAVIETGEQAYRLNVRPRFAHNDALTLLVETGVVGLALMVGLVRYCLQSRSELVLVIVAFLCGGIFGFPLYHPDTAFLAALVAGHLAVHRRPLWHNDDDWRAYLRSSEDVPKRRNPEYVARHWGLSA